MPEFQEFGLNVQHLGLTDEVLAHAELTKDPLYRKIPQDRLAYYVDRSLQRGREAAQACRGMSIRELYRREGLRYEITDRSGTFHQLSLRAQIDFNQTPPEVVVYAASLRGMADAYRAVMSPGEQAQRSSTPQDDELERLVDIHLAHEFFHYVEYRAAQFTNDMLEPVEVFRLGRRLVKRSSVVQCSEIAAHAFCKEMMGLPFLPNVLDYAFLIQTGSLSEEDFYREVEAWKSGHAAAL
ncbi:hypothetical protein [Paenibacillus sp. S28]|uniref:hypothetical protein n=1 Tax=Paenibacillus sp. S28 TaxID=2767463 RepID=UPI00190C2716|nr:hypothetical protein [Paenibacillus sp. S28]MBJ9989816.1 hypothetical protein [Paenibacillus sp. S28]